jgi:hypothetical protein
MIFPAALLILACPYCTYAQFEPTWILFASLRLLAVLAISYRRLDLVRTLGAFVLFEVGYFYAWRQVVWYSHPAMSEGIVEWIALGGLVVLSIGLPAACLLYILSRASYFRLPQATRFTRARALLLMPAMLVIAVAHRFAISS